jgi:hypothetical protein
MSKDEKPKEESAAERRAKAIKKQTEISFLAFASMMQRLAGDEDDGKELRKNIAVYTKKQHTAFVEAGFTEEQALALSGAAMGHFTQMV